MNSRPPAPEAGALTGLRYAPYIERPNISIVPGTVKMKFLGVPHSLPSQTSSYQYNEPTGVREGPYGAVVAGIDGGDWHRADAVAAQASFYQQFRLRLEPVRFQRDVGQHFCFDQPEARLTVVYFLPGAP